MPLNITFMPHEGREVLNLARALSASMALFVAISAYAGEAVTPLILTEKNLGPLRLRKGTAVTVAGLQKLFPKLRITHEIRSGDSPDFHHFEVVAQDGELLFTVSSFIEGTSQASDNAKGSKPVNIHILKVMSPRIPDKYGLRVGSRAADIVRIRGKKLLFGASHFDVYLGAKQIFYNIQTPGGRNPEEHTFRHALRGNWPIVSISWPTAAWE